MKKHVQLNRGMSLIELIIYMSMLVVMMGTIVQSVLVLSTHYRGVRNTRDIEDSAIAVIDRLVREVRNADEIIVASSTFIVSPGAIAVRSIDTNSGQSTTTRFFVQDGKVRISENGVDLGPLTKESVSVLGFTINQIATSNSQAIKVELSLRADEATPAIISKNFYTTVVLRGTYQ